MPEQTRKQIKIDVNTVNKVKHEQPLYEITQCFFEEEYRRADQLLYDLVCDCGERNGQKIAEDEPFPNVISFLGSRGRGKTSVMMSFYLSLNELKSKENTWSRLKGYHNEVKFFTLSYIDAAVLEENEYILDVILAKMWDEFHEHAQGLTNTSNNIVYLQQRVKSGFSKVKNAYRVLKQTEDKDGRRKLFDGSVASELHELSASMNLRHELTELIENYIAYLKDAKYWGSQPNCQQCYLVLAIDDIDMSTKAAHHILEEIRRFLSVRGVIILLTADFTRLKKMYASHFREFFYKDEKNLYRFVNDYLGKVLPYNMRIHMPELQENFDGFGISKEIDTIIWKDKIDIENLDEKGLIFSVMWHRYRICLDGGRRKRHFLQSSSLREMINYFERLFKVEDERQNLLWMKSDLKDRLAQRIVDEEQRSFIERLCLTDYEDMNNAVINFIRKYLQESPELRIKDKSLGQVLYGCSLMENDDVDNIEFVNCILLLYSIALTQMKNSPRFVNKMVGNSLFGGWEYKTLSSDVQNMEFITGFYSRSELKLVLEQSIGEKIKRGAWKEGLKELAESQKEKIMGWLYSLLFVNISFSANGSYHFSVKENDRTAKILKGEDDKGGDDKSSKEPEISIFMHGIARKSCFGFLHCGQSGEIGKMKNILEQSMRELTKKILECAEIEAGEEETDQTAGELACIVWEAMEIEETDVEPFPVQNVEILYGIGRALEDVVGVDNGKDAESFFEKMIYEYQIIDEKLVSCDRNYKKIGITTDFSDNFRKRIRTKIFLDPDYLKKGNPKSDVTVHKAFIDQLGSLYYTTNIWLDDPT